MKTDLYTKTVLTVIAVCLTVNLLKEFEVIPSAQANTTAITQTPQPIAAQVAPVDVNIVQISGKQIYPRNVKSNDIEYSLLPISIEFFDSNPIKTNLVEVKGKAIETTNNSIDVKSY